MASGNFATLNPLVKYSIGTFSNGNLTYASGSDDGYTSTIGLNFKSYCEVRVDAISNNGGTIGFRGATDEDEYFDVVSFQENASSGKIYHYKGSTNTAVSIANIGGTVSAGNIIMMAYDPATYKWWVGVNGTWRNSGDPANGTGFVFQGSATMFENMGSIHWGAWNGTHTHTLTFNFGQDDSFAGQVTSGSAGASDSAGFGSFFYSPPDSFLATCSGNMVVSDDIDPAGDDGETENPTKQFGAVLYTGNGGSNAVTGLGFQPDLVWGKCRSHSQAPILIDSVRGQGLLFSSLTNAEQTSNGPFMTSYDSDGFTLASSGSNPNDSGRTYVAWCWRAGGSASSDASGDITVNRSTNDKSKFSILTYTGNGSSGSTIAHGLGVKPAMTIIKERGATNGWNVWHQGYNNGDYDSFGSLESSSSWYANQGSNGPFTTDPTTSLLTLSAYGQVNASSDTYVAYVWADVEGMQKFGSFEGNSDANGPFVYTGFRPQMVFVKAADANENWQVRDTARSTFNADSQVRIYWNSANAEGSASTASPIDFLSNGFKVRGSNTEINGATMLYGAWADQPGKYSNAF